MEIDRLANFEDPLGARDHRAHGQPGADRNTPAGTVAPGELPIDHGVLAITAARQDPLRHATDQDDRTRQARRRRLLRAVADRLGLPADTEIEVEVDPASEAVRFMIRLADGSARELPEAEVQACLSRLQQGPGGLCDASG